MKFSVDSGALAGAVALVKTCVSSKTTLPILTHIVLDTTGGALTVRGTDLDKEAASAIDAEIEAPGTVAVPGDVLQGMVKRFAKNTRVAFDLDGNGRISIEAGRSRYQLRTLPPDELPTLARHVTGAPFALPVAMLRALLDTVIYAVCRDEKRWTLAGVHFHIVGGLLRAVATDTKRFAYREVTLPEGAQTLKPFTVPTLSARALSDFLSSVEGDAQVTVNDAVIKVEVGRATLFSRLIDGDFPDYQAAIKLQIITDGPALTIKPKILAEAIERVSVVYAGSGDKYPGIKFTLGREGVDLASTLQSGDQAVEDIAAEIYDSGQEFTLSATFLAELLKNLPDGDIDIQPNGTGRAVLFSARDMADQKHIIMPMAR